MVIDKEKLIEAIVNNPTKDCDKFSSWVFQNGYLNGSATRQNEIIDIINEQPQVANDTNVGSRREWYQKGYQDGLNADKWIPCEERLPSESGCYLVTTDGRYNDIIDIAFYHEEDEVWFKASKILAWTDLPHPYKKEGAE